MRAALLTTGVAHVPSEEPEFYRTNVSFPGHARHFISFVSAMLRRYGVGLSTILRCCMVALANEDDRLVLAPLLGTSNMNCRRVIELYRRAVHTYVEICGDACMDELGWVVPDGGDDGEA